MPRFPLVCLSLLATSACVAATKASDPTTHSGGTRAPPTSSDGCRQASGGSGAPVDSGAADTGAGPGDHTGLGDDDTGDWPVGTTTSTTSSSGC